ncbi:MAG: CoB--CoM heterodisulfide reductase iron-sulfur subunit A family protein [Clostridiales bacterium]|nr:CoB--CoM heterodisulfide reductase iron-sulfur subunit A family protein [Clostridiales bacterium]
MARTGVIICHCGSNIASVVDVERVALAAGQMPGVTYAATNKYTCSISGQDMIKQAIAEHELDRLVIASCTPRMHETTFRKMLTKTSINPYMLEIANIREQCSWVHTDKEKATEKAIDLVHMAVAKVLKDQPLFTSSIPVHKKCLVVGGGIAGIQAALDVAEAGYEVTLVEREPSIGGKMVMLDKTFPTLDCSACISTPKMAEAGAHPNIRLMTSCEISAVTGYIGNFQVTIRQKPRYVNHDTCTGCGLCEEKCPTKVTNLFDQSLSKRKAIYKLFPQAVPAKPVIDSEHCTMLKSGKCGLCSKLCPLGCINFEDQEDFITETFGAIVLATGYDLIDWAKAYPEYGGGKYANVISGLQFERLVNASGPTEGHIQRPGDGAEPKTVVIVKCVGSRDPAKAKAYCSRACCMYAAKHAHQILEKIEGSKVYVFYIDVRTPGKGYEEFYDKTRADGAVYIRGRVSKIYEEGGKLICKGEDTLIGKQVAVEADMVVLETAMEPAHGSTETAATAGVSADKDGWLTEAHPKLRPVETQTAGVYLCGTAQGPKDIPDTVAQASAAAAKVLGLLAKDELETSPMISVVDAPKCSGCGFCEQVCPVKAISMVDVPSMYNGKRVTRTVAQVNSGLCSGCGACSAACRTGCIDLLGFTNKQILEEVDALWQE